MGLLVFDLMWVWAETSSNPVVGGVQAMEPHLKLSALAHVVEIKLARHPHDRRVVVRHREEVFPLQR